MYCTNEIHCLSLCIQNDKDMTTAITVKDIMSVIKNDNRFQGNQATLQTINVSISKAQGDKNNIVSFAKEVKSLIK